MKQLIVWQLIFHLCLIVLDIETVNLRPNFQQEVVFLSIDIMALYVYVNKQILNLNWQKTEFDVKWPFKVKLYEVSRKAARD